ncbi:hypothetical protein PYCCODRAFT_1436592 [Trametes coccinea BRFM310]|uniref:Uncharacterized protein n=1 Tax=Trametes coccinea (strain BRFM310) TaxID=1353009 RepID=A0A1Y2IM96_TRAC3|nr:hypothetical protein PYCCODRAFT_1436592 [Trametes coccinea BRFM310]
MENLPLDLLRRIFELACTDGGYTGNSLSLTSKAIRKASRATRFHSIFLNAGPRRLRSFLDLYERECDASFEDKPRIRHLYASFHVSDLKESQSDRSRAPPSSTNRPALSDEFLSDEDDAAIDTSEFDEQLAKALRDMKHFPAVSSPQCANQTSSAEYREPARTLFRLVAPDLWSLVLQVGYNYRAKLAPPILEDAFPLLRELVVVGSTNPRDLFVAGPTNNSTLLPSLVHLHLGTGVNNPTLHLSSWSLVAPTVTHLRITGTCRLQELELAVGVVYEPSRIAVHPSPLVSFVQRISRSLAPHSKTIPPPPTYPSLRYLLIQPDPAPGPVGFCGTPMVEYVEAIEALEEFLTQCRSAGIQGTLLPPLPDSIICGKLAAHVKWQWTKRLEGDLGYWDVGEHI